MTEKVFARGLIVVLFAGCLASIASAQSSWWRTYGDSLADNGHAVRQTADGGYIIGGSTASFGAGVTDVYLVKTDASGMVSWTKTFGGSGYDEGRSVLQTSDSGYVVVGQTASIGAGSSDVYLIKTDAQGSLQWTPKTFGGPQMDVGRSIQRTADGGYIIAGYTQSPGGPYDVYLIKTDADGGTSWTRTYGGSDDDGGLSVQQTQDGGYIIAGYTRSSGAGMADVYLVRTDSTGDSLWTKTFGGIDNDDGASVQLTLDGGYIVAGSTRSTSTGSFDLYLIKTDDLGAREWVKILGGQGDEFGWSVYRTRHEYIITGSTSSYGAGQSDVYLIKTDANGNVK